MKTNKKIILGMVLTIALGMASLAHADFTSVPFLFDPDGGGGTYSPVTAVTLDWTAGNALIIGGNPLSVGKTVTVLYQANLGVVTDNSTTVYSPSATGEPYYFSVLAGFSETVDSFLTNGTTATATFTPNTLQPSYFSIYANPAAGDNLAGTGFAAGTEILHATLIPDDWQSSFTVPNLAVSGNLDKYQTNDWVGQLSTTGGGHTSALFNVTLANTSFFPNLPIGAEITTAIFPSDEAIPFTAVDPARQLTNLFTSPTSYVTVTGTLGAVNGGIGSGPNVLLETDGRNTFSFPQAVPEPSTVILLGLGLLGLAGLRKKLG